MSTTEPEVIESTVVELDEVADSLKIHRQTAYNQIKKGVFPIRTFKVGARYRCLRSDLDAFLRGETV